MQFTITNREEGLWPTRVRLTLDVDQEAAHKILEAAIPIHEEAEAARAAEERRKYSAAIAKAFDRTPLYGAGGGGSGTHTANTYM